MPQTQSVIALEPIVHRIFELRGQRVMLDEDLAVLYAVPNKALLQAVKRNPARFKDFVFQVSYEEWDALRSRFVTSSLRSQNGTIKHGGSIRFREPT